MKIARLACRAHVLAVAPVRTLLAGSNIALSE